MTTTTQRSSGKGLGMSSPGMVVLRVLLAAAAGVSSQKLASALRSNYHQLGESSEQSFGLRATKKPGGLCFLVSYWALVILRGTGPWGSSMLKLGLSTGRKRTRSEVREG